MRITTLWAAVLVALVLPTTTVAAAPNPSIGFLPGEHQATVEVGTTHEYTVTFSLTAADGSDSSDLGIRYLAGGASFAPATSLAIKPSASSTFQAIGTIQQAEAEAVAPALADGQYVLRVQATLQENQRPGDFSSNLALVARDPETASSSPGVVYGYTFHIPPPPNRPPTAAASCAWVQGRQVTCDASATTDPDDQDTVTFDWDFGDGATTHTTGPTVSHTFAAYRAYVVRVTATDSHGATAERSQAQVPVDLRDRNNPPTAGFTFASSGRTVSFDARAPFTTEPDGDTPLAYTWSFGDDTFGTGATVVHKYDAYGLYAVRLTVTDAGSAQDTEETAVDLREGNRPPVASLSCTMDHMTASCSGAASSDPDGDAITTYFWSFEAGASATGVTTTYTYPSPGSKTITLSITDSGGAGASAEQLVTANPVAPPPPQDADSDGLANSQDNCPQAANADQKDTDGDGHGDACDNDDDGDGASDEQEAAAGSDPLDSASTPTDTDGDGFSNAAESSAGSDPAKKSSVPADLDGDGRANEADNCPRAANADQADLDGDHIGDVCDSLADGPNGDADGDGVKNSADNCRQAANANQADTDGDKAGDACDSDIDGDGAANAQDDFPADATRELDTDGDGVDDGADDDDDGDHIADAKDKDPKDPRDAPYLPRAVLAVPGHDGSVGILGFTVTPDPAVKRYLVWREASPLVLVTTLTGGQSQYFFVDDHAPGTQWRYHVQAQFATTDLLYDARFDVVSNDVTADGPILVGCTANEPDSDGDGLCDAAETAWGLDPTEADSDGDGLDDGDELRGSKGAYALPNVADSDGDGRSDAAEIAGGFDPLAADASRSTSGPTKATAIAIAVGAVAALAIAGVVFLRRKPNA